MNSAEASAPGTSEKTLQVEIERILPGGVGLAHAEGRTLFVALAAPGDVVRVTVERIRGKIAFASITEIIKPSPERVEPPCPYFGRCGGCDFQQLNYQAQLDAKVEIIRDCLRRIGGITELPEVSMKPSPDPWHYRARAEWQFDPATQKLGYFERGSQSVCDVAECAVLVPALEQQLKDLRAQMRAGTLPQDAQEFQAAAGDDGVSLTPARAGRASRSISAAAPRDGKRVVTRTIAGEQYRFNAGDFFQVNHDLLPALIDYAIGDARGANAMDFYCGVGLFTVPLARRFGRVIAVEANRRAAEFARRNLEHAGLKNTEVVILGVADWLKQHFQFEPVDLLLLDPPRSGTEDDVIRGILALKPRKISYVSCDPATLARDLKKLIADGYFLDSMAAYDMFPQTHHVETVARLCRDAGPHF